jgi:excisionase family DNA binding protein
VKLSLSQVATLLGKSERQIRYMVKSGRLAATKAGKEWRFETSELPLTDEQRRGLLERAATLTDAVADAVAPAVAAAGDGKRRYSVTDLQAYKVGAPLYRRMVAAWGAEDTAARHLRRCLELLARGCHAFHGRDKRGHYAAAREEAASTVVALLLHVPPDGGREELAEAIEQTMLAPLDSLIRRAERKSRSGRFEQFGAAARGD